MQKIEIIALSEDSKKIMERLQRRGVVEICNLSDEGLSKLNTAYFVSLFEKDRVRMEQALETVNEYAPEKVGLLDGLINGRRIVEKHDFGKKASEFEAVRNAAERCLELKKQNADLQNEIARHNLTVDLLCGWLKLDIRTDFKETESTRIIFGSISEAEDVNEIINALPECCYLYTVDRTKLQTNVAIICLKEQAQECLKALGGFTFSQLADESDKTPAEKTEQLRLKISECENKIKENTKEIIKLAQKRRDFEFMIDYLTAREEKYEQISKLALTDETVIISGYIPQKYVFALQSELERKYKVAITVTDTGEEDEDVPVLLQNSEFSSPVEPITEMYALPAKHDLDPTPIMSFFYYFFFGMMLSDAGYGVLMVIGTLIALKKFNLEEKMRKTLKMFFYCGISTVIWGALFGSWFGDIIQVVAREFFGKTIVSTAIWFQPLDDPIKLLLYSFGFGICHLFLGLGANFYNLWRQGKKWDAVCEVVPVYLTVLGVAPIAAGILTKVPPVLSTVGGYVAIVGVVLLVLTGDRTSKNFIMRIFGGLYGLYNMATGYLSDILSYSRLLALGLATGSIAGVINLIGSMPSNKVVKAIMLTVVFLVGHVANLAINLLGAYVHTDRLQFVELFSKFYEGGGRAFEPFSVKTKYIKFKEENINE